MARRRTLTERMTATVHQNSPRQWWWQSQHHSGSSTVVQQQQRSVAHCTAWGWPCCHRQAARARWVLRNPLGPDPGRAACQAMWVPLGAGSSPGQRGKQWAGRVCSPLHPSNEEGWPGWHGRARSVRWSWCRQHITPNRHQSQHRSFDLPRQQQRSLQEASQEVGGIAALDDAGVAWTSGAVVRSPATCMEVGLLGPGSDPGTPTCPCSPFTRGQQAAWEQPAPAAMINHRLDRHNNVEPST